MLNNTIFDIIEEQNITKTSKTKPIADAIKDRKKITFYYSGPKRPKKDSVKSGYRIKAEAVALGLSKRGKLIMRAWVQPPSTTKTGFAKHGWRTFILGRMSNVQITDEVFTDKRPGYKEGEDSGMSVTYTTADWTKTPDTKQVQKPQPVTKQKIEPEVKPTEPTQTEPTPQQPEKQELPQPKPEVKPEPSSQDDVSKELYNKKKSEWIDKQKEVGGNIKPGQGTRERFKKEVEKELPQPKPEEKPSENPEDEENNNLQESLKRIKSLMLL